MFTFAGMRSNEEPYGGDCRLTSGDQPKETRGTGRRLKATVGLLQCPTSGDGEGEGFRCSLLVYKRSHIKVGKFLLSQFLRLRAPFSPFICVVPSTVKTTR